MADITKGQPEQELEQPSKVDKEELEREMSFESGQVVHAPIDKLGIAGRYVRHRLLASILIGTPVLLAVQRRRTPTLTKLFTIASFLGTEEFYAALVCLLTWIVDMRLARLCCILMGIGFYVANFLKNSLCLPRPPCPPVKPLENAHNTWALPSHHAVLGVIIPWYIWFYCLLHYKFSPGGYVLLFSWIVLWSSAVMFSRVYLGVHSPADVVTGSLCGCIILAVWFRVDDVVDRWTALSGQGIMLVPLYASILLFLHPRAELDTKSFTESNCMVGVAVGFILARSVTVGRHPTFKAIVESAATGLGANSVAMLTLISVLRFLLGVGMVLATRALLKFVSRHFFAAILSAMSIEYDINRKKYTFYTAYGKNFRLPPVDAKVGKSDEKPKELVSDSLQRPWNLDHPVKFVTYICMGFTCSYLCFFAFQWLGLVTGQ